MACNGLSRLTEAVVNGYRDCTDAQANYVGFKFIYNQQQNGATNQGSLAY